MKTINGKKKLFFWFTQATFNKNPFQEPLGNFNLIIFSFLFFPRFTHSRLIAWTNESQMIILSTKKIFFFLRRTQKRVKRENGGMLVKICFVAFFEGWNSKLEPISGNINFQVGELLLFSQIWANFN